MNERRTGTELFLTRNGCAAAMLIAVLQAGPIRRAGAEDHIDFKYMWYQEDNNRIRVLTPAVLLESDLTPTLKLKIEGVYNAISGASPTGAPPIRRGVASPAAKTAASQPYSSYVEQAQVNESDGIAVSPVTINNFIHEQESEGGGGEREGGRALRYLALSPRSAVGFHARAGATPKPTPITLPVFTPTPQPVVQVQPQAQTTQQPAPASSGSGAQKQAATPSATPASPSSQQTTIPLANIEDEREAVTLELTKTLGDHAITGGFAYSSEQDYESMAVSLHDAISFNEKNTTLSLGTAYTHDRVDVLTRNTTDNKDTIDLFLGLTQVIDPETLFNVNFMLSHVNGYLDDQYKVVELNGVIVPEHRPDTKDKRVVYVSLSHLFKSLDGTAELGYRFYDDTFGIMGHTFSLAWYQKVGEHFIVRPTLRYYQQTAADFYGVSFSGTPEFYSSDYRVSALQAVGYGIDFIWKPSDRFSFDVGAERYEQSGRDNVTFSEVYPKATILTAGARWWF